MNILCPCGSQNPYSDCCALLHTGQKQAQTAEQLMRSRYTAFALGLESYLHETLHPRQRTNTDRYTISELDWLGLEILSTSHGALSDKMGKVEFRARYTYQGKQDQLHELSRFKKFKGRWYYVDGIIY